MLPPEAASKQQRKIKGGELAALFYSAVLPDARQ
ncbi:hypothetical protein EM595_0869 [Duffyella gerundensis]|uniref:Uncharacterized protein n=1 Tax=Duffyella gerundensis TaxID=1619313 RepID=A0A0U5GIY0_9GAMM|nr:hypothetical protein EM595_0869 [Duffyella gerundensis]